MNKTTLIVRALPAAVTAVALALASAIASGEESSSKQEIRIESGKIVTVKQLNSRFGMQPEALQLTNRVSYADLDLSTPSGAAQLKSRIRDTASSVCKQLMDYSPSDTAIDAMLDQKNCVEDAIDGAMTQARQVIASAEAAKKGG
jgi:UrcA family protein